MGDYPMCKRCCGTKKLVWGLLLLLNAYVWPKWFDLTGWIAWIAILMVLSGLLSLLVPNKCSGCAQMCSIGSAPKKKK